MLITTAQWIWRKKKTEKQSPYGHLARLHLLFENSWQVEIFGKSQEIKMDSIRVGN